MTDAHVHGYDSHENARLADQADALVELLHSGTRYPAGSSVLEVGCGVGAQTLTPAQRSPLATFTSIDISPASIAEARRRIDAASITNVSFEAADVDELPFPAHRFDHVFACFVLEHLARPADALASLRRSLRPGGTITLIEGDHGSAYFHPDSSDARAAIECQVTLQRRSGGDALIGRRLYPMLKAAHFADVHVSPRVVYVDASRPHLAEPFIRKTFTAMIAGVRGAAVSNDLIEQSRFDAGVRDLYRTAEGDGTFCYTFFKGVGFKPGSP